MTEKRLIVDDNYNLVDTVTDEWLDDTQVFDLANKLAEENEEFRKRTKELIAVSLDYPTINLDLMAEAIKSLRELI